MQRWGLLRGRAVDGRTPYERAPGIKPNETNRNEMGAAASISDSLAAAKADATLLDPIKTKVAAMWEASPKDDDGQIERLACWEVSQMITTAHKP